ncbi:O-antigen ligase family protein [Flavobacterium sp.]|uniref:O-antigen ligase family protein n=1 Tax=Flavobacterium sp. TaxID=239 RepID=UPI002616470B|nr:O-antigen ligase family protein [Flavobacterium sp.]
MKKKVQLVEENIDVSESKKTVSFIIVLLLLLYLSVDFLPKFSALDISGIQWVFISVINICVGTFIYFNKKETLEFNSVKLNKVSLLYLIFTAICGISIFVAQNKIEGIVSFVKLLTTATSVFLLSILAQKKSSHFLTFSVAVSIILFYQSFMIFVKYYSSINVLSFEQINSILSGNTGNKNVLASVFALKIPFAIYCFFHYNNIKRYFFLLTIFLSTIVIFITESRTNLISVSLFLIALVGFLVISKQLKSNLKNFALLLLTVIISYSFVNLKFASKKSENPTELVASNNNLTSKKEDISGNRFSLWENTFQIAKENPILGKGLGSYKIESIPYESKHRNYWAISKQSHNDFLQIAAETGFINMLVYLLIFFLAVFYSFKTVTNKENSEEQKWISFVVLISILAFGLDSLLNFPIQRPITQIHFAIILFWFLNSTKFNSKSIPSNYFILPIAVVSCVLVYSNILYFKSLVGQNKIFADENSMAMSYDEVDKIVPDYPNLSEFGNSIKAIKAKYLIKENNESEALNLLKESKKDNPYLMDTEYQLSNLYLKQKNNDSIHKYFKKCFDMFPLYKTFYINYMASVKARNNPKEIEEAYNYVKKYNNGKPYLNVDSIINLRLKRVADSKTIQSTKPNNETQKPEIQKVNYLAIAEKYGIEKKFDLALENYEKALLETPNNAIIHQNIGICNIMLKNYSKGIESLKKALNSPTLNDGKTEYYIGVAYFNSNGDRKKACEFLNIAKSKNYQSAIEIANTYCK